MKKRVFIAVGLSEAAQKEILEWERGLRYIPARWLVGKNLHITLIPPWYADEKEIEKIKDAIDGVGAGISPFAVEFKKVEFGPLPRRSELNPREGGLLHQPRLIWAEGAVPDELVKLKDSLEKALNQESEKRSFRLHLTLARFRPEDFEKFPVKKLNEKVLWRDEIKSFALMESRLSRSGADYEILFETKLDI